MRVQVDVVRGRGLPHSIELEAASLEAARQLAIADGLTVLAARGRGAGALTRGVSRSRKGTDIPVFVEQLRDLLVAGLSVIEALDALELGAARMSADRISSLRRQLAEGKTLSSALEADAAFPALLVALVRASELTSDLPDTLSRFLEHERRVAEVRHRVVSTAIYPLLVTSVGAFVLAFLLFYVMPRFARIFDGMPGDLPWSARWMVSWSRALQDHAALWSGLGVGCLLAMGGLASSPSFRAALWGRALSWGPVRDRLKTYILAGWYRSVGMLVQGGIPLPQALGIANAHLPAALKQAGEAVERGVREGLPPSTAHVRAGMATPVAEQLLLAGERTGDLGSVLAKLAHFHESAVSRDLERVMRALEPVAMAAIGLGVGIVVVLMYLPIFELASAIQ